MPLFVADEVVTAAKLNAATARDWTSFVPVLETSGTQPVLGTGKIEEGRWMSVGDLVFVQGQLRYGASGVTIGTGNYFIKFGGITNGPPDAQTTLGHVATDGMPVGQAVLNDNNAGFRYMLHVQQYSATQVWMLTNREPASGVSVTSPITVQVEDRFRFFFRYEPV